MKDEEKARNKETIVNDAAITIGETIGHVALAIWSLLYLFIVGPIMFVVNLALDHITNRSLHLTRPHHNGADPGAAATVDGGG